MATTTRKSVKTTAETVKPQEVESVEKVNWRSRIPEQYIVINKERYSDDISSLSEEELENLKKSLDDSQKLVLLAGFQHVMELRGFISAKVTHLQYFPENNTAVCSYEIVWKPDEKHPDGLTTCGTSSANDFTSGGHPFNNYVVSLAENRAMIRAIKQGLGIYSIYGKDELPQGNGHDNRSPSVSTVVELSGDTSSALKNLCDNKGIDFSLVRKRAEEAYKISSAKSWTTWSDIDSENSIFLMNKILEKLNKKG